MRLLISNSRHRIRLTPLGSRPLGGFAVVLIMPVRYTRANAKGRTALRAKVEVQGSLLLWSPLTSAP